MAATDRTGRQCCPLGPARAVVAVLSDPFASARVVAHARALSAEVPIFVRTRYLREAERMRSLTEAVAEEIETSLEVLARLLAEAARAGERDRGGARDAAARAADETSATRPAHSARRDNPRGPRDARFDHQLATGDWAIGRTLVDVDLRAVTGAAVIGIRTGDGYLSPPPTDRELQPGDLLYLLGSPPEIAAARAHLARGSSSQ